MKWIVAMAASLTLLAVACVSPDAAKPAPDAAHNSQNSLDWTGAYRGILPCADCPGIETVVVLQADGRYRTRSRYQDRGGENFTNEGVFTWNAAGSEITLTGAEPDRYRVQEYRLLRLARDGSEITGPNASAYVLAKLTDPLLDRYWRLTELNGKPVPELPRPAYIILRSEDARAGGLGGCNNFGGGYTLDAAASRIQFGHMVSTQMACTKEMDVEQAFHQVLQNADNYSLNGDTLTLNKARMAPLARFEVVDLP
jgi:copper homeostasis protein (lipoprotein)